MLEESKKTHNKRDKIKVNEDVINAICLTKTSFCSGTKNNVNEPIRGSIINKDSILVLNSYILVIAWAFKMNLI